MTRKDYVGLADAFARTRPERPEHPAETPLDGLRNGWREQWLVTRDAVASVLQYDNPRFDRARFIRATEA
jgi:hypothetical protein